MNFTDVNGVTLHFTREGAGQGTSLVFLNSLGSDLRIWDDLVPHFAGRFPIVRYDKRGHGLSDCPTGPYTLRDFRHDLAGLLDHLGIQTALLVGVSVGGMIAMDFAVAYPARVQGLVLCDTGTKIGTPEYWDERITAVRQNGIEPLAKTILARWFSSSFARRHPAHYRGYYNMLTRTPVEGYAATCEAIRDADLRAAAPTISAPVLVVCGAEDLATPPELGQALAATLPHARFVLIPQAGHLPSIEQPAFLANAITSFLRELEDV